MSKTIAIFGAGPGLGLAVAHRFGREGYNVALVGRRQEVLEALRSELTQDGITAAVFTADLRHTADIPSLITAITARFGHIDVVEYAPITITPFIPAENLTPQALQDYLDVYLLTPIAIVQEVLPGMIKRGTGGILIGQGPNAIHAAPLQSGIAPALAAARNYYHSLHGEVADKGIYVGTLVVNALIVGSAGHRIMTTGDLEVELPDGYQLPTIAGSELANVLWAALNSRDRVETIHPAVGLSTSYETTD
jgi:NADP-dependent 3-hydroxy acid dehydrogenase YdfG